MVPNEYMALHLVLAAEVVSVVSQSPSGSTPDFLFGFASITFSVSAYGGKAAEV